MAGDQSAGFLNVLQRCLESVANATSWRPGRNIAERLASDPELACTLSYKTASNFGVLRATAARHRVVLLRAAV